MTLQPTSDRMMDEPAEPPGAPLLVRLTRMLGGDDERGRAKRAALAAFVIRIVSAGIAYLSQVLLARWMGSFEYGVFVWVWVWVLILGGLSSLGMNVALIRFLPEYRERGEHDLIRGILLRVRLIAVGASTVVMALGLIGLGLFPTALEDHYLLAAYLALFCLPLYTLTDIQDGIGRGYAWINLALIPPYIWRPALILIGMVVARLSGLPMSASTAAGCAIVATWASGLVQLALIERRLAAEIPAGPRQYATGYWLRTSFPIFVIYGCELVLQNIDVLFVSAYLTPSDVGVYYAALKTISLIAFVHYAVGSGVASRLSALNARGDRAELASFIRDAAHWTFWPSLAGAAVLLLVGTQLLGLFGPEFERGYAAMCVLVVGLLTRAAVGPAEFVLRMLGEQTACAAVLVGSAVAAVVLNLVLVPSFGLMGAATASSMVLAGAAMAFYLVARRRLGVDISVVGAMLRR